MLASLGNVDIMYQFSLDWFQRIFSTSIASKPIVVDPKQKRSQIEPGRVRPLSARSNEDQPVNLVNHMNSMIERLTWNVYRIVCVGLFAQHQLTFSFTLCASIMRSNYKFIKRLEEENEERQKYSKILTMGNITDEHWNILMRVSILAKLMTEETKAMHDGKENRNVKKKRFLYN